MSFLDHVEILRWHLIRSVVAIVLFAAVAFVMKDFLFGSVIFAHLDPDFATYKFLCKASAWLHIQFPDYIAEDGMCIGQNLPMPQSLKPAGQFMSHLIASLVAGLVLAFPYVFWEIWRFISPALRGNERKGSRFAVFWVALLFLSGVSFAFFIIAPLSVNFFLTYDLGVAIEAKPDLNAYVSLVVTVLLACGLVFQLPVVVYFLTKLGVVTPTGLKKFRKHALVAALILSAIITPPDVFSQVLVSFPLLFLYEVSIFISRGVVKRQDAGEEASN